MENVKHLDASTYRSVKKFTASGFQKFWKDVATHKFLFLISIALFLTGAFLINESSTPTYMIESSFIVKESGSPINSPSSMLLSKEGQAPLVLPPNPIEEIAVITSYPFIRKTLDGLDMEFSYYERNRFRAAELSENRPFSVQIMDTSVAANLYNKRFAIAILNEQRLKIWNVKEDKEKAKEVAIGTKIHIDKVPISINLNKGFSNAAYVGKQFEFEVHNLNDLAFAIKSNLSAYPEAEESPVIKLNIKTTNTQKGVAFLNALTKQYIVDKYEEKSRSASQALSFINDQINSVKGSLGSAESNLASFRANNTYTDAQEMAGRNLAVIGQLDEERSNLSLNDRYYSKVLNDLSENTDVDQLIAPSSVGVNDGLTEGFIKQLADLQLEKNSYLASGGGAQNPLVQDIDVRIRKVRSSLRENVRSLAAANRTRLSQVNARSSQFQSKVFSIPSAEKKFTEIKRSTEFNDALYQFLMQKRVEAGIMKASATIEDKIVEPAFQSSAVPVSPKKTNNYAMAFLFGLALPLGVLQVRKAMSKKVSDKEEILSHTSIPQVGAIYHNLNKESFVVNSGSRTAVSESFRILRSNLGSNLKGSADKVILVSSLDSGEGKSFISTNLAFSFALAKKKTILINLDLRVPSSVYQDFGTYQSGISEFLGHNVTLKDIIKKTENDYLDVINTGNLPDNPAELLMDNKLEFLLEYLKAQYDYILIDTPPIGLVADPLIISRFANTILVVVREKYTMRHRLGELEEMYKSGKIQNVFMVINDVHMEKKGYRNAYYYQK